MSEVSKEIELEIAHVLFIDIVGYSKLLIDEQRDYLQTLNEVVRGTDSFRTADGAGKLTRLPTGDGMGLVFATTPDAPVVCALQIAKALRSHPDLRVRMGIHSGPVSGVVDVNERSNVAGAGINMAQRVMDCGDAGYILLSKRVADDLEQYRQWRPHLHDLGEIEVKHGVKVGVVNFSDGDLGNPELPEKIRRLRRMQAMSSGRRRLAWSLGATALVLALGAAFWFQSRRAESTQPAASPVRDKSVAVLPFENLSSEKENAYFADGIQEEILTRLSKIADLKVISRTSTHQYQSKPGNLLEIAKQLGVANIVEGSVQKAADQVRVNVQLINAQTDSHLWADTYDRKLTDIFAVETEIATKIAERLQAKLTEAENAAVEARPTENTEAHDLYLKARYFIAKRTHDDTLKAIEYYNQAISKDPNYALAYAGVAEAYALITGYSRFTPAEVLPKAKAAAEKALTINPHLPEAHTALGAIALSQLNLTEAKGELEQAIILNPNSAEAHSYLASLLMAASRFDPAIAEAKRAVELDPLSLPTRNRLAGCYRLAGRLPEAIDFLRKTIELDPAFAQAQDQLGLALEASDDLAAAIAQFQQSFQASGGDFHSLVFLSHLYGIRGERDKATQTATKAKELEQKRGAEWAYGYALISLGLGDKEQAMKWLERSYQTKESFALLLYIRIDPLLSPLHGDPRFEKLADTIIPADTK